MALLAEEVVALLVEVAAILVQVVQGFTTVVWLEVLVVVRLAVSALERIAELVECRAVVAAQAQAMEPCRMWAVVRASTSRRPHSHMLVVEEISMWCDLAETSLV